MFAEDKITPNLPGTQVVHKKELIYMLQPEHMYPSKEPVYFFISGWENTCIAVYLAAYIHSNFTVAGSGSEDSPSELGPSKIFHFC